MTHPTTTKRAGLCVAATLAVLAFAATPALANSTHAFREPTIGSGPGQGAGELSLVPGNQFEAGSGVAVNDETHDVYVADTGNNRVDEFTSGGTFVIAFGRGVGPLGEDTCTTLTTCKAGVSGIEPGELEAPTFIAIDNDPASPSHGDVYVAGPGQHLESPDNLVSKFNAEGGLEEGWGVKGQLDGSTAPEGPFGQLAGLAVDNSGDLWVYVGGTVHALNDHMYEFEQGGGFTQSWQAKGPPGTEGIIGGYSPQGIAVDGVGDLYVSSGNAVQKLSPTGGFIGTVSAGSVTGLAVDHATNDVYVDQGTTVAHFAPSCQPGVSKPCAPVETLGPPELAGGAGLAVDSSVGNPASATVYATNTTADEIDAYAVALEANTTTASAITAATATLDGTVNPQGAAVTDCHFEYGTSTEYGHSVPCEQSPAAIGAGIVPVEVHAKLAGLRGGTVYHFRLVVKNAAASLAGDDEAFTTATVPVVANGETVDLTLHPASPPEEPEPALSAQLQATVNPEGLQVTHCVFEYGTSAAYGASVPCAQKKAAIGFGTEPVPVSATVAGLSPDTTYYWRLSVRDEPVKGEPREAYEPGHTFVYATSGAALPDGRAYEMVSPPQKNGASLGGLFSGVPYDFAEDGSRLQVAAVQCFASSESCTAARDVNGEPFEFTRTPAGWVTTSLAPPATVFSANTAWKYSAGTGMELFRNPLEPSAADDFYARQPDGSFLDIGPTAPTGPSNLKAVVTTSATADFSHLIWESVPNFSGEPPIWSSFDNTIAGAHSSVYEYVGAGNKQPFLVGVSGGEGSTELISTCETFPGAPSGSKWGAMSADGRTVYVTAVGHSIGGGCPAGAVAPQVSELYARVDGELPDAHTVAISQPECGDTQCKEAEAQPGEAYFGGASADGSKAFFLDGQELTDDASQDNNPRAVTGCAVTPANVSGCNLYEYDLDAPAGHNLVAASAGDTSGLGPQVQGVLATSADGSHVYFVANGVLASGASPGHCHGETGSCNLYVYERDARYPAGHIAFIAAVPGEDFLNWGEPERRKSNVTPDGRFLVFESHGDLTPDDSRDDGSIQIFRYDAESEQLARISIGDDGFTDNGNAGTGDATIVLASVGEKHAGPPRGDPTMSNDGSYVFFQSPIGLTPQALNDVPIFHEEAFLEPGPGGHFKPAKTTYAQNVYEYHEGRTYLISDGRDESTTNGPCDGRDTTPADGALFDSGVCLLGTSATGSDVFFTTADSLLPPDTDTQIDIYDARVCTSGEPCIQPAPPPLPPCLGEACHGIPAATPSLLAPGSASFDGEGNIASTAPAKAVTKKAVKCKKGFAKNKKNKCVKSKPRKKQQGKKARRASNHRGAK
jgi:hypothetical protein